MSGSAEDSLPDSPYLIDGYDIRQNYIEKITEKPDIPLSHPLGSFWRAQSAGWLFFALFGFVSRILTFENLKLALYLTIVLDTVGFLLTAFAHALFHNRIHQRVSLQIVLTAMVLSVFAGAVQMQVAEVVRGGVALPSPSGLVMGKFTIPLIYYTLIFIGWSLAYLWISAETNASKAQILRSQAQEARLHAELNQLRSQLDSHFLFNALNTVAMEIPENQQTALEMTNRVAAYLRYSLEHHDQRLCPLVEEIRAVQNYLRIQEIRFEHEIECTYHVAPTVRQLSVPHLILQPLVENAVKHGRAASGLLSIELQAEGDGETLEIEVRNSGRLSNVDRDRPALGLANARRRLELHYPGRYELSLFQAGGVVIARLCLRGQPCYV